MRKIIETIFAMLMATFSCSEQCYLGAVEVQVKEPAERQSQELAIITAAERNYCFGENFRILLAIRKAENGGPGREFGIRHRLCRAAIDKEPGRSLDIQAGWAAATIVKNRRRWELAGGAGNFIDFLADRYVPIEDDPVGNKNWKANVKFFYGRFKDAEN